jgi:hypothetical protein
MVYVYVCVHMYIHICVHILCIIYATDNIFTHHGILLNHKEK